MLCSSSGVNARSSSTRMLPRISIARPVTLTVVRPLAHDDEVVHAVSPLDSNAVSWQMLALAEQTARHLIANDVSPTVPRMVRATSLEAYATRRM